MLTNPLSSSIYCATYTHLHFKCKQNVIKNKPNRMPHSKWCLVTSQFILFLALLIDSFFFRHLLNLDSHDIVCYIDILQKYLKPFLNSAYFDA